MDVSGRQVRVHVEELVLHGFPPLDQDAVGQAVERELGLLVAGSGLRGVASRDEVAGGSFQVPSGGRPGAIGARIAERIHGGLVR